MRAGLHVFSAHRDMQRLLLRRRVRESLLDDCPAISPRRKEALLRRFGSVKRIRKATANELESVPGIGKKSAQEIFLWLRNKR